jgi:hypothetical protein
MSVCLRIVAKNIKRKESTVKSVLKNKKEPGGLLTDWVNTVHGE